MLAVSALALVSIACVAAVQPLAMPASKKGLQVEILDDAIALGVKHAALNFNITELPDLTGSTNNPSYELDGRRYFMRRDRVAAMDRQIQRLSNAGMSVYLIVLTYQSGNGPRDALMIHPKCATNAPNRLGQFNTVTEDGRRWLQAIMEFCAERWSRAGGTNGAVVGYIMGNEVNSHWWWANMGRVSMEEFTEDYLRVMRLAAKAVRKHSDTARVYLSLEHHWNIRYPAGDAVQSFPGRTFLDRFASRARQEGDFDWHIAFHPYPENLFEPRFWRDSSATTNVLTTPRITFRNIELLPQYLNRPELLFEGKPRRVILSEQGFHTPKGTNGEAIQAAAYAYAYKKIDRIEGIDAFILHRHVDHPHEGGLLLGLRHYDPSSPERRKKLSWEVFRTADTPEWEKTFEFALPIVGLQSWDQVR